MLKISVYTQSAAKLIVVLLVFSSWAIFHPIILCVHPQIHKHLLPQATATKWMSPLVALRKPIRAVMLEACPLDSGQYGSQAREWISIVVGICVSCGQAGDPCTQRQCAN